MAQIAKTLQNFNAPKGPPFDFGEEKGVSVGANMNFFTSLSLFLHNKFLNYFFSSFLDWLIFLITLSLVLFISKYESLGRKHN